MAAEMERHEGDATANPFGDHGHNLHLALFGGPSTQTMSPSLMPSVLESNGLISTNMSCCSSAKPRIRPGLVATAFIFDQTARCQNHRVILRIIGLLDRRIGGRQAVGLLVLVGRVFVQKVAAVGVERFAVKRNRIREVPDHAPGLGVAERGAAVLDGDPLDTAGKVGLPVGLLTGNRVDRSAFVRGQVAVPAEFLSAWPW